MGSALYSELRHDPTIAPIITDFVASLEQRLTAIETALARDDAGGVATLAHTLADVSACYGFPTIAESARRLERLATTGGPLAAMSTAAGELVALCRDARP
jgi:HPt (histidine-containing phosphotransfer) domain-containing protein